MTNECKDIHEECAINNVRFTIGNTQYEVGYNDGLGMPSFYLSSNSINQRLANWEYSDEEDTVADHVANCFINVLVDKGYVNPKDGALKKVRDIVRMVVDSLE